jgi:hypothetical protein
MPPREYEIGTPEPENSVSPLHRAWHLLPLASVVLLIIYAIYHPGCLRWFTYSGGHCLYMHALMTGVFIAMIYFGDLIFALRYDNLAQRRLAGRITGTALLAIWNLVLLTVLW